MSKSALALSVLLSLIPALAFGAIAGQDLRSSANVAYCAQTLLNATATVSYLDSTGNYTQELPTAPTSVSVQTSMAPTAAGPATTFVAPPAGSPVHFTTGRSFCSGASLEGKCVTLAGRISTINGTCYLEDGSTRLTLNPATGGRVATQVRVMIRTDLLTSAPADGSFVTITGVCRKETGGELSLLPMSDAAHTMVQ